MHFNNVRLLLFSTSLAFRSRRKEFIPLSHYCRYCDEQFIKAEMAEAINMTPAEFDMVAAQLLQVEFDMVAAQLLQVEFDMIATQLLQVEFDMILTQLLM